MKEINFTKVSGAGNDFILFDNRGDELPISSSQFPDFVKEICQRRTSVGADGVLLLERSRNCDVKMRIFNPDGTEVEMCGNGARCVAAYLGGGQKRINVETKAGKLEAEVVGQDRVMLKISEPKGLRLNFDLMVDGETINLNYINTGVPHAVSFVDDLEGLDVKKLGSLIRYHEEFQPEGTNADFVKVLDETTIKVRTYERGVEDETLSCGTGVVASAIISALIDKAKPPVLVETKGALSHFRVQFDMNKNLVKNVYLEGEAKLIYDGRMKTRLMEE